MAHAMDPNTGEIYFTQEHKAKLRVAAIRRAANKINNVSICNVIYANAKRAEAATKISARTILRRCDSSDPEHKAYFRIIPKVKPDDRKT